MPQLEMQETVLVEAWPWCRDFKYLQCAAEKEGPEVVY